MQLCDNCLKKESTNSFQVGPSGWSDQREGTSTKTKYVDLCLDCRTALLAGDFDTLAMNHKKVGLNTPDWTGPVPR